MQKSDTSKYLVVAMHSHFATCLIAVRLYAASFYFGIFAPPGPKIHRIEYRELFSSSSPDESLTRTAE
jgi:hypothetical protein